MSKQMNTALSFNLDRLLYGKSIAPNSVNLAAATPARAGDAFVSSFAERFPRTLASRLSSLDRWLKRRTRDELLSFRREDPRSLSHRRSTAIQPAFRAPIKNAPTNQ